MDADTPMLRSDRVRLVIVMTPKPELSLAEFHNYWLNNHSKVFTSIGVVKRNLLKYEQFHIDSKYIAPMTAHMPGFKAPPFAGMAIFEAASMEKILEVFLDEEYRSIVLPDEENFIARKEMIPLCGTLATIIEA